MRRVRGDANFDVLVIGSGAAGLAAAVSGVASGARVGVATKTTLQACNSAKAQGGIQAAFGDDDSPAIHAEDVMRSSHDTASPRLVEVLTSEAPSAIHWLEEIGVEFTRSNGGYRLARCGGATRKRLLQVGDRTGHAITRALRDAYDAGEGSELPHHVLVGLAPGSSGWKASFSTKDGAAEVEAAAVVLAAGGRCYAEALDRGELSTNHPNATGEVTRVAVETGAETRDLDALQYHPNGGAWPETMQGYSIPETTRAYGAVLLNADGEEFTDSLGPRDAVSQAIFDEVAKGKGVLDARRPPRCLAGHDQDRPGGRGDLAAVHAPPLPRCGHRPAFRADLHLPGTPLPERRARDRRARRDHSRRRVRLRRDRRRDARKESDDGQLPARVHRLRAARG